MEKYTSRDQQLRVLVLNGTRNKNQYIYILIHIMT